MAMARKVLVGKMDDEGPSLDDSRGVAEMVRSDQTIIKKLTDAYLVRAQLEVDPPRAKIGGWNSISVMARQ